MRGTDGSGPRRHPRPAAAYSPPLVSRAATQLHRTRRDGDCSGTAPDPRRAATTFLLGVSYPLLRTRRLRSRHAW